MRSGHALGVAATCAGSRARGRRRCALTSSASQTRCSAQGVSRRASARSSGRVARGRRRRRSPRGGRVRVGRHAGGGAAHARDYVGPRGHRSQGRASHRRRAGDGAGSGDSVTAPAIVAAVLAALGWTLPAWVAPAISRASRELGADVPLVLAVCAQESALRRTRAPSVAPSGGASGRMPCRRRTPSRGRSRGRWRAALAGAAGDVALRVGPPVRRRRRRRVRSAGAGTAARASPARECAVSYGVAWTDAEDAIIRKGYKRRDPLAMILARLSGRSLDSMKQRAKRLRCVLRPHWTAREDRVLRMEWELVFSRRTLREKLPVGRGAPSRGARRRSGSARLRAASSPVKAAAKASGYSVLGLYGVIQRQGVIVRRHCGNHQETRVYTRFWWTCSMSRRPSCATSPKPRRRRPSPKRLRGTASGARRCAAGSAPPGHVGDDPPRAARASRPRAVDAAMRGEVVPATEGVPWSSRWRTTCVGASRAAAPTTPEYAPPVRAGDGADEVADAGRCACGDGPRRSLLRAVRRRARTPDVPADLRAEITASGHLAGVTYAAGTDAARGPRDAAACVGCVRARGELGAVRGDAAGEHGRRARVTARAGRWD